MADDDRTRHSGPRGPSGAAKSVPAEKLSFQSTPSQNAYLEFLLRNRKERMPQTDPMGMTRQFKVDGVRTSIVLTVYEVVGYFKAGKSPNMPPAEVLQYAKRKRLKEMPAADINGVEEEQRCASCTQEYVTKKCGRCKKVYYCDQVCQRRHWPTHKHDCSEQ